MKAVRVRPAVVGLWHFWAGLLAMSLGALPAAAKTEFVEPFMKAAGLACPPACITCHDKPDGGIGWNDFGKRFIPLVHAKSNLDFVAIVRQLKATDVDSDEDGVLDFKELENGTFPGKSSQEGGDLITCPGYGCGARVAPRHHPQGSEPLAASGACLTFMLLMVARRVHVRKQR